MDGRATAFNLFSVFGDMAPAMIGAFGGGVGSFLRESAWLYSELHSRRRSKLMLFLFVPLWVFCGALFGGVLGLQYDISLFYAVLAGAAWRAAISNTGLALRVISSVVNEIAHTERQ